MPDAAIRPRVFWGDQHVHTAWSADAGMSGATLTPEDAVRFARGEQVTSNTGQPVKLSRPLDWVAVTDHSDGMGVISEIKNGNPELMADKTLKRWHDLMPAGPEQAAAATMELINAQSNKRLPPAVMDPKFAKSVWLKNNAIMEKYNEPGRFTAFIAYEWTSNAGGGDNLHRNVIYRDGRDKADQMIPYTTFQSENPEDLWTWMQTYEEKTGGSLLAIPHNGNLSNGRIKTFTGQPLTMQWAQIPFPALTRSWTWRPNVVLSSSGFDRRSPRRSGTRRETPAHEAAAACPGSRRSVARLVFPVGKSWLWLSRRRCDRAWDVELGLSGCAACHRRDIDRDCGEAAGPPRRSRGGSLARSTTPR